MLDLVKDFFTPLTNSKIVLIIFALGFVVYSNSFLNGFIFDDIYQIIENDKIYSLKSLPEIFLGGTLYNSYEQELFGIYYKPMMTVFFTIITSIFGLNSFLLHFFQITIHLVNSVLVLYLFNAFFKKKISAIFALVFLVHPINSEAVYYLSAVQENLFFLFGLSSLLILMRKDLNNKLI